MVYRDLKPEQQEWVVANYKSGVKVGQIQGEFGLSNYNFYTLLRQKGVEVGRTTRIELPPETVEGIISDYKAKVRTTIILEKYNVSTTVLYRVLEEHGISKRSNRNRRIRVSR